MGVWEYYRLYQICFVGAKTTFLKKLLLLQQKIILQLGGNVLLLLVF